MGTDRRRAAAVLLLAASAAALGVAPGSQAQTNPIADMFTTTAPPTTAAPTTATTAAPPEGLDVAPSQEAPEGAADARGDGAAAPEQGIVVPPEAQRIIDSVKRTGSNDNSSLLAALEELTGLGMSEAEAYRVGLGRFPVAGAATYSHDWLYPRYGPGFRFHLGTDVFAAYGTPLRAPVDGIVTSHQDTLGGLSVKVQMEDRTYFYLAHLSGLVEGFAEGMPVRTGDIVGYVGDSGNARGGSPHVHVGLYPKGGPPVDPKPILDQFLVEATDNLPLVIEAWKAANPSVVVPASAAATEARLLRPALGTGLVHAFTSGGDAVLPAMLYVLGTHPRAGAGYLVQSTLDAVANDIDWSAR